LLTGVFRIAVMEKELVAVVHGFHPEGVLASDL
jgi:hypothetical protein